MVGLIAMTGANILLCMSSSLTVLVVGRLLQGMAAAVVWAVGFALVPETVGQDKAGEAIGLVSLGLNIGIRPSSDFQWGLRLTEPIYDRYPDWTYARRAGFRQWRLLCCFRNDIRPAWC